MDDIVDGVVDEVAAGVADGVESDLRLRSGTVRIRQVGADDAPLVICVHGLSVNLHVFDHLVARIAGADRRVVAFDLRGRGRSAATAPGSYGLRAHARDVLEVADQLGAERFDCVGWSLGALIAVTVADLAADRLRSVTLIDQVCGITDAKAKRAVREGLGRLDATVSRPDEYLSQVRSAGMAKPWSDHWARLYAYELVPVDGGFTPATSKSACVEDLEHPDLDRVVPAWRKLTMPVLVVRALTAMGGGLTTPDADLARFRAAVPAARVVELDGNHFGVMTDDRTVAAISELLLATS